MKDFPQQLKSITRWISFAALLVFAAGIITGTLCNPHFWLTANQHGDILSKNGKFHEAAQAYNDPLRIGVAQYRDGDFKSAAKTFTRVPGAAGIFNMGNAQLMGGNYDAAIVSYDRALGLQPGWKEALENKALAVARKAKMTVDEKTREQENADAYKPDQIVEDLKGTDKNSKPQDIGAGQMSDAELQATWLRRVQTTPGDFLRTKFAYQASQQKGAAK